MTRASRRRRRRWSTREQKKRRRAEVRSSPLAAAWVRLFVLRKAGVVVDTAVVVVVAGLAHVPLRQLGGEWLGPQRRFVSSVTSGASSCPWWSRDPPLLDGHFPEGGRGDARACVSEIELERAV